jgi:hypothetical protein
VLRGNLSSRPFYNERLVALALVLVGVIAGAITLYNGSQLLALSGQRRTLRAKIDHDQQEAARIRTEATRLQQSVDRSALNILASSTREANELIERRTFSWTVLFDLIEKTMPIDVRLVAVSPRVEKGEFKIDMIVVARRAANVDDFIEALQATGSFHEAIPIDQSTKEDGTLTATISTAYVAPGATRQPKAGAKPATKPGGAGRGQGQP